MMFSRLKLQWPELCSESNTITLFCLAVNQRINFKFATITRNTLNSSQPANYLRSLFNYHIPARSLRSSNTNLLSVPRVHTTFASRGFSIAAPSVGNWLYVLTFALVHHILSVVFLKPTVSIRPSVPPSSSHRCLRFGFWCTLCTIKDFTYLLTYLIVVL